MIDRFMWCVCCLFVLIMQFILSPITTNAADVIQVESGKTNSAASKDPTKRGEGVDPAPGILLVNITAGRDLVAQGELVRYDLTIVNTSKDVASPSIRILDVPPIGFKLKNGSVRIDGTKSPDPMVSADGKTLIFTVKNLVPAGSTTIRFETEITAGSKLGKAVNYASAISSGRNSNVAKVSVLVKESQAVINAGRPEVPPTVKEPEATAPVAVIAETAPPVTAPPTVKEPEATAPVVVIAETAPPVTAPPLVKEPEATAPVAVIAETAPPVTAPQDKTATSITDLSIQPEPSKIPLKVEKTAEGPTKDSLVVPKRQNLTELIGKSEVPVLADVDGHFVKNMGDNQILENEFATQVSEATLLESIRAGRSFSRESLAALARTEQAKAQTGQAFALLLPSVSVRANSGLELSSPSVAGTTNSSDAHSRTDAALTARQPLFDLPSFRDWHRREVVEKARGENYRVSDGDSYLSAVTAYLSLLSSRLQTDMTRDFETQLKDFLIYIEKRTNAGAASISDMSRVRARSQATLSSRLEQESAHAAAGVEFVRLTNLVPQKVRIPLIEDVGAALLPKTLELAVSTAMKYNPEIAALTAELEAAELDQLAVKGRYLPRVDAEYTYNYSLHAGGATSSAGQKDQRIMAVLNWNLFSGGADSKTHVERTARHKELQYRLDDQRRRVIQTLSANFATLATTGERITSGYQELNSISTAADAMSKRMLSGNQSLLDLLDVYDRFYQVRSRLVSLHILEMSTVAQLVRLTLGTPGGAAKINQSNQEKSN